MSFEKCVRHPRAETKHHPRANSLQTLPVSVCMSSLLLEMPTSRLSLCPSFQQSLVFSRLPLSLPTCLSLAKSLQEFAAVLQNLEDERTRMVSNKLYEILMVVDGREWKLCFAHEALLSKLFDGERTDASKSVS